MDTIFDFTKAYAGGILKNGDVIPCSLQFHDQKIIFTLISAAQFTIGERYGYTEFSGYISTETGIQNFKALDAFQISNNYTSSKFSEQRYVANGLIVTHETNNLNPATFRQADIGLSKLEHIGRFCDVEPNPDLDDNFTISPCFRELSLLENTTEYIKMINPVARHFTSTKTVFTVTIDPYLTIKPSHPLTIEEFIDRATNLGWYFQLLFGIKQRLSNLELFDTPLDLIHKDRSVKEYFYYNQEIIESKLNIVNDIAIHPFFLLDDLKEELPKGCQIWMNFDPKQKLRCRLFFNEINSKDYVIDDRFKNLCAIIQGLDAFTVAPKLTGVEGNMNRKLRESIDDSLERILCEEFNKEFLHELFIIIGVQRDHYQHLNKPLKFDLNKDRRDMVAVNQLLTVVIKFHLLTAIKLDDNKIRTLIKRDILWFSRDLTALALKLSMTTAAMN